MPAVRGYEADPCHSITGEVGAGYRDALVGLAPGLVLAVDSPVAVDWERVAGITLGTGVGSCFLRDGPMPIEETVSGRALAEPL
jgi:hypothetical protein